MDVQTHARQGPAHVLTDVVHGEAPCITHAHGADLCPPGVKRGCTAPRCQHQPQGTACAPGCERGTRFCLPLTRGRSRQRVAGDRFAEPFENLMEREKNETSGERCQDVSQPLLKQHDQNSQERESVRGGSPSSKPPLLPAEKSQPQPQPPTWMSERVVHHPCANRLPGSAT